MDLSQGIYNTTSQLLVDRTKLQLQLRIALNVHLAVGLDTQELEAFTCGKHPYDMRNAFMYETLTRGVCLVQGVPPRISIANNTAFTLINKENTN